MEMTWSFLLTGLRDPKSLDSDETRHKLAWRQEARKRRAARAERKHRVPAAVTPTPSRPEAVF